MPTDWSFLDENGDLITGCASCSGSGLEGFDPDSEVENAHKTQLYVLNVTEQEHNNGSVSTVYTQESLRTLDARRETP
jgi:hypothetical protein